uniref:Uncharacterized protein n=1 Tax=Glossina austeni TaxID=7395 RepID=A0A1A9V5P5_GLOAU
MRENDNEASGDLFAKNLLPMINIHLASSPAITSTLYCVCHSFRKTKALFKSSRLPENGAKGLKAEALEFESQENANFCRQNLSVVLKIPLPNNWKTISNCLKLNKFLNATVIVA